MDHNHEGLLSRTIDVNLKDYLLNLHDGLAKTVDFGVEILLTDFERGGTDLDLPILLFLRNLISTADGISVLIKNSIIEPANNLLRTALENFFSIEYLLGEDQYSEQRARSFMVWHFAEQQRWLKKGDNTTSEFQALVAKHKKDKSFRNIPVMEFPMADKQWKGFEALFESPELKETKNEYDRLKAAKKRTPMWYQLYGGPSSLEELANRVGYPAVYEMLYRGLSISSHGNNIISGKLYFGESSNAELASLRDSYGAESVVNHCMNFCRLAYRTIITKRMPFMAERFNQWLQECSEFNKVISAVVQENIDRQNEEMKRAVANIKKNELTQANPIKQSP